MTFYKVVMVGVCGVFTMLTMPHVFANDQPAWLCAICETSDGSDGNMGNSGGCDPSQRSDGYVYYYDANNPHDSKASIKTIYPTDNDFKALVHQFEPFSNHKVHDLMVSSYEYTDDNGQEWWFAVVRSYHDKSGSSSNGLCDIKWSDTARCYPNPDFDPSKVRS